jgi:hypothetical protein
VRWCQLPNQVADSLSHRGDFRRLEQRPREATLHPLRLYRVEIAQMGCGQSHFGGRHCAIGLFGTKHHLSSDNDVSRILRFKSACMIDQFSAQQNAYRIKLGCRKGRYPSGKNIKIRAMLLNIWRRGRQQKSIKWTPEILQIARLEVIEDSIFKRNKIASSYMLFL